MILLNYNISHRVTDRHGNVPPAIATVSVINGASLPTAKITAPVLAAFSAASVRPMALHSLSFRCGESLLRAKKAYLLTATGSRENFTPLPY